MPAYAPAELQQSCGDLGRRQQMSGGAARSRANAEDDAVHAAGFGSARWRALGTAVQVLTADPAALAAAVEAVEALLGEVDVALSRFRSDSELTRLNSGAGHWQPLAPLTVRALRVAVEAARWTGGLVDPTVGTALIALGYDRTYRLLPADAPGASLLVSPAVGWKCIELDDVAGRVRWPAGVVVDLGATAKALAADLAADRAWHATGSGVLVNLGGDLSCAGSSPDGGWNILIADDADPDQPAMSSVGPVVSVRCGGLATSGTRARRWRRGGNELHHLLDPRTGRPTAGPWRTVSVTASTCVLANSASTAAIVAGANAPNWLAERGFPARLVQDDGAVRVIGGWPPDDPAEVSS